MPERRRSWRSVAIELGLRMEHHARCGAHPDPVAADPECPCCRDRESYLAFQKRINEEGRSRDH